MFEHRIEKLPLVDEQGQLVGPRDDARPQALQAEAALDQGRPRPAAGRGGGGGDGRLPGARRRRSSSRRWTCCCSTWPTPTPASWRARSSELRARLPRVPLVVGNVATAAAARFLLELGADAIKVGVGPGRGCRTRLETGAGVPQLQAVREVYLATGGQVPVIADGGRAGRQGPVPRDRLRRLVGDARQHALGHRRSARDGGGGPGHAPEDEALPRHDLARGGGGRRGGRRARRGAAHSGRGAVGARALRRQRRRHPRPRPRPPAVGGQLRRRGDAAPPPKPRSRATPRAS